MPKNRTLFILSLVMFVNALSYGTIVPLLYPYAAKFGMNATGLSLLFVSFSLFQFLATPVIGRLSDKYGRKPLLVISLLGTSFSLALFASAQSVFLLFLSRILDGITGGNNSVAQAIVADTTTGQERTKAFGILGAAFGAGFLFGPAIGGILSQVSLTAPFWFASGLALLATFLGVVILDETLSTSVKKYSSQAMFSLKSFIEAFTTPIVGIVLLVNLLSTVAHQVFIIGFQAFSVDVLVMNPRDIGLVFSGAGLTMIVMQGGGVSWILKRWPSKEKLLRASLILAALSSLALAFTTTVLSFTVVNFIRIAVFAPQLVVLPALISQRTKAEDQGGILGINQSVASLGQIIGPLLAGLIAMSSVPGVFGATGVVLIIAFLVSVKLMPVRKKFDL